MTLPLIASHCNIKSNTAKILATVPLLTIDVFTPITLLVVGILGLTGSLSLIPAACWAMVSFGIALAAFSIISYSRLCCKKSDTPSKDSIQDTSWEEKLCIRMEGAKKSLFEAVNGKSSRSCKYEKILFMPAYGSKSDLFFDSIDGEFSELYPSILETKGKILIVICPQGEEAATRWKDRNWFTGCQSVQPSLKEFCDKVSHELMVLNLHDSGLLNVTSQLPSPIKKALGLSWF